MSRGRTHIEVRASARHLSLPSPCTRGFRSGTRAGGLAQTHPLPARGSDSVHTGLREGNLPSKSPLIPDRGAFQALTATVTSSACYTALGSCHTGNSNPTPGTTYHRIPDCRAQDRIRWAHRGMWCAQTRYKSDASNVHVWQTCGSRLSCVHYNTHITSSIRSRRLSPVLVSIWKEHSERGGNDETMAVTKPPVCANSCRGGRISDYCQLPHGSLPFSHSARLP
jgi:hypothetical protein